MLYEGEIEKWIEGYEELYTITNFGRVFSLNYHRQGFKKERKLTRSKTGSNHAYIQLNVGLNKSGITVRHVVSILVAEAFIGPNPNPDYYYVLHKDGNSTNNHIDNLYYGTQRQNVQDSINHGTCQRAYGVNNGQAKLDYDKVQCARALYDAGYSTIKIGSLWGVDSKTIWDVGMRKNWRHVPELSPEEYKQLAEDFIKAYEEKWKCKVS